MRHIRLNPDLLAGLFFISVGCLAVGVGADYRLGTPENMGPGFFPIMLGTALLLLGIAVAALNIRQDGEGLPSIQLRPIIVVLGAVAAFGLLVGKAGLVITIGVIVALCSLAGWRTSIREQLILFVCLATIVSGVFVVVLGLPIPLWPHW
jgi:putative tricarboxylic transport membrane protein